jgi:hypothetical protein
VKIDLRRTFESGQAYVALSRATKLETLEVFHFDASKVKAHPRVTKWMRETGALPMVPGGPVSVSAPSCSSNIIPPLFSSPALAASPLDEYNYDDYMDDDDAIANYFVNSD